MGAVSDAVEASVAAATHLTPADDAAVEALRTLAVKIDADEERWQILAAWNESQKLRPPSVDNVSLPTLLKYCEALGLTPSGRTKLGEKKPEAPGGKLALLRNEAQAKRSGKKAG